MPKRLLTSPIGMAILFNGGGAVLSPTIGMYDSTGLIQIPDGDVTPTSGDGTDYGLTPSLTTVTKTFTLKNSGTGSATGVSVALSGSGAGGFTVTVQPSGTIAAAGSSTFQVRFDALTPIAYTARVTVSGSNFTDQFFDITASSLYSARVLALSPWDYRKMDEGTGTSIADSSTNAHAAATATGIAWGSGSTPQLGDAPFFDGSNDKIDMSAAGIGSINLDEGCVLVWFKVNAAGVWTDTTNRFLAHIQRNSNNRIRIFKTNAANTLQFDRIANASTKTISVSYSSTGWHCASLSWSVANDQLIARIDGVQVGSTQTGLVAMAGSGLSDAWYGAFNTTPTSVWHGWLDHGEIFSTPENAGIIALGAV